MRIHFGTPMPAFSFISIYMFAGKIAIKRAIMPHAAYADVSGMQSSMPRIISAMPLIMFSAFGAGNIGGIIRVYMRGTRKWLSPANMYSDAMRYKCQGSCIMFDLQLM